MRPEIFIFLSLISISPATAGRPAPAGRPGAAKTVPSGKVWTNTDMEWLRTTAPITIFNPGAPARPALEVVVSGPSPIEQEAAWFAQQMGWRREQIDQADAVIQRIESIRATGEGISNVIPLDRTDPGITPEATIEILQNHEDELAAEIDFLQDKARKDFVPREAWR